MFYQHFPLSYHEPLFRPPAEAESLILQITYGCSWNKCAFCEMYSSKTFHIKSEKEIIQDIDEASKVMPSVRKIFLADGNPMVLSTQKLLPILTYIKQKFPKVRRISTYALPSNIEMKSPEELKELYNAGLSLLYVGIESGDDEVLKMVNKSESSQSTINALLKAKEAGMKLSVIILNGLGGKKYKEQHAKNSALILNAIQPEYASSLVLSFPFGITHFQNKFNGIYEPMGMIDLFTEMKIFIEHTNLYATIFRSDHASNYLVLNGILNRDKELFIKLIENAINNPTGKGLRKEWQRGL
ncbi:MAG TPA: radical SAM protein [Bacteroidales bacterium]|nr:radical SAM protein [Bacteroidales bacterium]HQI45400.1 radical SAM protein [Bacteroidales bacterium]